MRRWWVAGALGVVLSLLPGYAGAQEAPAPTTGTGAPSTVQAASESADPVRVLLTRMNPAVLSDEDNLIVSGRVANASLTDITDPVIRLRLSAAPLADRRQIPRIGRGAWDGYQVLGTDTYLGESLAAGAQSDFRIVVPRFSLPLSAPGVYQLSAEVLGGNGVEYTRVGMTRTFLPFVPNGAEPVVNRVVWLWPLAAAPARDVRGVLLNDAVPEDISDSGRLRTLVDAGRSSSREVSWIVDSDLLQTVSAMQRGYLVDVDGQVQPGTRAGQARLWLEDLTAATAGVDVRTIPYADVDAEGLLSRGLSTDLVRAVTSAPSIGSGALNRPVMGGLAWAPGGSYDAATIDALAASGVRALVLRDSVLPPSEPSITPSGSTDIATASGVVRAVLTDSGLRAALALPQQGLPQVLLARQQFLAELTATAFEAPAIPRTLVAGPSGPRWNPSGKLLRDLLRVVRQVPWLESTTLTTLLSEPPSQIPRTENAPTVERTLPGYYLARIDQVQSRAASTTSILANPAEVTEPIAAALLRSASSAWRFKISQGEQVLQSVESTVLGIEEGVSVLGGDDVILSGDTGSVPVTLANELDQSVRVGVRLVGSPAVRLESDVVADIAIEAGKRESLVVPVRVIGGDPLRVNVELLDAGGEVLGRGGTIELRTTAYARAARWFTIGAAALLGVMVVFDIWRRVRRRPGRPA